MKDNLVTKYLQEQFLFGGEWKTKAQIIAYLKSIGGTPSMIDRYLQGLDLRQVIEDRYALQ